MPKQILKINQFHGGLNSNSDARDVADNELTEVVDAMVDELGKIRLLGGYSTHGEVPANVAAINVGYGLFQFSHDRLGASTTGTGQAETGDDYLAIADAAGNANIDIYSRVADAWGTARIDLGSTTGMKTAFYAVDGALRVSDGNFGANNQTMWYGYIQRYFFGDGVNGYDGTGHTNGIQKSTWHADEAAPKALPINWIYTELDTGGPVNCTDSYPINVEIRPELDGNYYTNGIATSSDHSLSYVRVTWAVDRYITKHATAGGGYDHFCSEGDRILVKGADVTSNDGIYTVSSVTDTAIGIGETTDTSDTDDYVTICNLSRSGWYGGENNEGWEFGISTLYDESKQESAVLKFELTGAHDSGAASDTVMTDTDTKSNGQASFGASDLVGFLCKNITDGSEGLITANTANTVTVDDLTGGTDNSWDDGDLYSISVIKPQGMLLPGTGVWGGGFEHFKIGAHVFAGDGTNDGISVAHPRVTGFKIYMRHENTETWYLQSEVDISKGVKSVLSDSYSMWNPAVLSGATETAWAMGEPELNMSKLKSYETETGFSSSYTSVGFDGTGTGFKTGVIANRMAYVGNVKIKDKVGNTTVHGDAVLKSNVNKFDSFTLDRIIEASVNDGDSIVKLETYADRLLIFKKNKLELLNISQDVEFLEDTFMHKGVSHPAATCKTDFGIAWVNKLGCYLYDGQKVHNLLEKKGRQIIKESDWATFTTNEPMIGYIPKKRQLLIVDDMSTSGTGNIFLYDIVTQSWIKGADATLPSQNLTNFITDWNGDLVFAHTTGNIVKWDDAGVASTTLDLKTKDIDFGQPGQAKKIYKVVITHKSAGSGKVRFWGEVMSRKATSGQGAGELSNDFQFGTLTQDSGVATNWITETFKPPATDISANALSLSNVYSIRLYIQAVSGQTVPAGFEINDISIIYRLKNVR